MTLSNDIEISAIVIVIRAFLKSLPFTLDETSSFDCSLVNDLISR